MTDKIRNEFAAYGLDILKRSVLLVLYEQVEFAPPWRRKVRMDRIQKRLGIPRLPVKKRDRPIGNQTDLIRGVLQHLFKDGLVKHTVDQGWEITPEGIEFIKE